jgi:cell division protein FtsI (penicillin-binding protein 3)
VVLSLNAALQTYVCDALDQIVAEYRPKGAVGILVEPSTGRVLAMASRPNFTPNDRRSLTHEQLVNRAIQHAFEPGSTFKPFVWAAAMSAGLAHPEETIDCERGRWRVGSRLLRDAHAYGSLTVQEGLVHSSNIMAAKLGRRLGAQRLHDAIVRFGFGQVAGLGLPGEAPGLVRPVSRWTPVYSITSLPMGQELQVTPLQLVMAYAALANGGSLLRPRLLDRLLDPKGEVQWEEQTRVVRKVVDADTARKVLRMLTEAVRRGTGKRAAVPGYAVAGKTGTAQKALPGQGYVDGKWVSSFVGIAPAAAPRLVCLVLVDEPQGAYSGGRVAAPAVGRILAQCLRHLGIPADFE